MQLSVHPDPESVAQAAADAIAGAVMDEGDHRVPLGLAGGSTPRATYQHLLRHPMDWSRLDLWLTDERWVPWDHEDSNGRMALATLAEPAGATLHRPRWSEHLDPDDSAAFYEAALRDVGEGTLPPIALLGMGTDGHTASLFPETEALSDAPEGRWFVANHVPQLDTWRLTVTPYLLQHTPRVFVIVTGADKAQVLAEVVEGPADTYPIQLLREAKGSVTFFVDSAAASGLSST